MKKLFSPLFLLVLFGCTSAEAQNFSDIQHHQFQTAIEYAQENTIVNGYSDGTFKPDNTINRAEFTKIIIETIFEKESIKNCNRDEEKFSDVSEDDWFAPYICIAVEEKIISGYPD